MRQPINTQPAACTTPGHAFHRRGKRGRVGDVTGGDFNIQPLERTGIPRVAQEHSHRDTLSDEQPGNVVSHESCGAGDKHSLVVPRSW